MPLLTVESEGRVRSLAAVPERSIREILDSTELRVRSACRGVGGCGLCRVRVVAGGVCGPTAVERVHLDAHELARGVRLACQAVPQGDAHVVLLAPAAPSNWRSLPCVDAARESRTPAAGPRAGPAAEALGAAVDLGTTNVSVSFRDLSDGRLVAGRLGPNPEASRGVDVLTRLSLATVSPEEALTTSRRTLALIGDAFWDIATREGIDLGHVRRVVVVGNSAQLALLAGRGGERLLRPGGSSDPPDAEPCDPAAWLEAWGLGPEAALRVVPPLAGFVGSDLLAGVLATRLIERDPGSLFVDLGTNSEIALWDGRVLWVTSAAGGPAFEGSGSGGGLAAETDGTGRVCAGVQSAGGGVTGGAAADGLLGSATVDQIAGLVRSGGLTWTGCFTPRESVPEVAGVAAAPAAALTKKDVDAFQRAKAAIGCGVGALLHRAGMELEDLNRVFVGGAFGSALDVVNAQEVGLLPPVQASLVELCGNTALAGCEELVVSPAAEERLDELRARATLVDLAQWPGFFDGFLEHLALRPVCGAAPAEVPATGRRERTAAFIRTAQYLAGLTAHEEPWSEVGRVLLGFHGADFAAVVERGTPGGSWVCRWSSPGDVWAAAEEPARSEPGRAEARSGGLVNECGASIDEVFETGFLVTQQVRAAGRLSLAFLPVSRENQIVAVLVVGERSPLPIPRDALDVYLALAGLVGTTVSRLASESELRESRRDMERLVEERTSALTRTNELLRREIAERRHAEQTIRHMAYHDALTELPNRRLFNDRLKMAIARAERRGTRLAIALLDLDGFKEVNDTLGHSHGDTLLRGVAARLAGALREEDTLARLGGDEFVALLPQVSRVEDATGVAGKLVGLMRAPFTLEGRELCITASIGVAVYPDHGRDPETLVRRADRAMYRAKEEGRDACRLWQPDLADAATPCE